MEYKNWNPTARDRDGFESSVKEGLDKLGSEMSLEVIYEVYKHKL